MDAAERFAEFRAHGSRRLGQRFHHFFLAGCLGLLAGDGRAGLAVDRLQRDQIGGAKAGNRSFERRFLPLAHTHLARDLGGDPAVARVAGKFHILTHLSVIHCLQEGRLLQLKLERLPQRGIEHRIARVVFEVGYHQHVLVGERRGVRALPKERGARGQHDHRRGRCDPVHESAPVLQPSRQNRFDFGRGLEALRRDCWPGTYATRASSGA